MIMNIILFDFALIAKVGTVIESNKKYPYNYITEYAGIKPGIKTNHVIFIFTIKKYFTSSHLSTFPMNHSLLSLFWNVHIVVPPLVMIRR